MAGRQTAIAIAMRMICAVALLFLGLAHQAAAAVSHDEADFQSGYVLPDGSIPILCIALRDSDGKIVLKRGCEVCRLAASTILPSPGGEAVPIALSASLLNPLRIETAVFGMRRIGRANSRAPPLHV
jgi:hypothetical protein